MVSAFYKGTATKLNLLCLLAAITIVLVLPFKKEIWYDETVSILCSKGISHDTQALFATDTALNSDRIDSFNTTRGVLNATIADNGNSFLYNIGLHWFTKITRTSVAKYVLFSQLWAVVSLIAFYFLCNIFLKNNVFTGIAIILLATDTGFIAMSHEIRAYSMGIMFVTLATIFLFRYVLERERPLWLFLTALFSVAAILSHYLTIYVVLGFLIILVGTKFRSLFSLKNIVAVIAPMALLAIYFWFAATGLKTMSVQNHNIQEKFNQFDISEVIFRSMKIMAMNFKLAFPAFRNNRLLFAGSFIAVIALYIYAIRRSAPGEDKKKLHMLFLLGAISSVFLVALSLRSQHYASLYFRYYSFGLPFSTLFIAYLLCRLFASPGVPRYLSFIILTVIFVPSVAFFIVTEKNEAPAVQYDHVAVAQKMASEKGYVLSVPSWRDAFLVESLLPWRHYLEYFRDSTSPSFTLYTAVGTEKIKVIREDK